MDALLLLVEIMNFYFLAREVKLENHLFIVLEVFLAQERINQPLQWQVWRLIHLFIYISHKANKSEFTHKRLNLHVWS